MVMVNIILLFSALFYACSALRFYGAIKGNSRQSNLGLDVKEEEPTHFVITSKRPDESATFLLADGNLNTATKSFFVCLFRNQKIVNCYKKPIEDMKLIPGDKLLFVHHSDKDALVSGLSKKPPSVYHSNNGDFWGNCSYTKNEFYVIFVEGDASTKEKLDPENKGTEGSGKKKRSSTSNDDSDSQSTRRPRKKLRFSSNQDDSAKVSTKQPVDNSLSDNKGIIGKPSNVTIKPSRSGPGTSTRTKEQLLMCSTSSEDDTTDVSPSKVQPSKVQPSKVQPSKVQPSKVQPSKVYPSLSTTESYEDSDTVELEQQLRFDILSENPSRASMRYNINEQALELEYVGESSYARAQISFTDAETVSFSQLGGGIVIINDINGIKNASELPFGDVENPIMLNEFSENIDTKDYKVKAGDVILILVPTTDSKKAITKPKDWTFKDVKPDNVLKHFNTLRSEYEACEIQAICAIVMA